VIKRNGEYEVIAFDKILARIRNVGRQAGITAVNYTTKHSTHILSGQQQHSPSERFGRGDDE
jgi:hypothetical protein